MGKTVDFILGLGNLFLGGCQIAHYVESKQAPHLGLAAIALVMGFLLLSPYQGPRR